MKLHPPETLPAAPLSTSLSVLEEGFLSVKELAHCLGISEQSAMRLVLSGELEGVWQTNITSRVAPYRIDPQERGSWRIPRGSIEKYIEKRQRKAKEKLDLHKKTRGKKKPK